MSYIGTGRLQGPPHRHRMLLALIFCARFTELFTDAKHSILKAPLHHQAYEHLGCFWREAHQASPSAHTPPALWSLLTSAASETPSCKAEHSASCPGAIH
ncbi:Epimerase Family Protein Sdr39U1 [Manis pentadactyla]|nr:Epimerase Family Protein Sdr39U1 [Manis pentadactyla]